MKSHRLGRWIFTRRHQNVHILYLELGVGGNTPIIIKYPFWRYTSQNKKAVYTCINYGEAVCPQEIKQQSVLIDGDIDRAFQNILKEMEESR